MNRIVSLDYLRGSMAFSVMMYHYLSWSFGTIGSEYLLGKLGIYAISIFYVLSGLSLTIVYHNGLKSKYDFASYAIKRIFRIFPLFWLVVSLGLLQYYFQALMSGEDTSIDVTRVFLNYTLLFGFVKPDWYLTTGAWSIGNEMVFYAFFPLLIILGRLSKYHSLGLSCITFIPFSVFAFAILNNESDLSSQWTNYINPFNQLFLFSSGVTIGIMTTAKRVNSKLPLFLLLVIALCFMSIPSEGDKIGIVTGYERLAFSFLCIAFCLVLYRYNPIIRNWFGDALKFLGDISYSLYLLHPLVAVPIVFVTNKMEIDLLCSYLLLCVPISILFSYLSFRYIEKPAMKFAKTLFRDKEKIPGELKTVSASVNN